MVFTDGSSAGKAAYVINGHRNVIQTSESSAQRTELIAVIEVLKILYDQPLKLFPDSQYVVRLFPVTETAIITSNKTSFASRLLELQNLVQTRTQKIFVGHIRGHSKLPGPLTVSNNVVDLVTKETVFTIEEATSSHAIHHQNTPH